MKSMKRSDMTIKKKTCLLTVLVLAVQTFLLPAAGTAVHAEETSAAEAADHTEGMTAGSTGTYLLPLFETSDIHGYLVDTSAEEYQYRLAYISDKVHDVRGYGEDYDSSKAILVDGGDIYEGNTLSNLMKGIPISAAYALMDYDAAALGNHEFDWMIANTVDEDKTMMDYEMDGDPCVNKVPVVCMNLYQDGEPAAFTQDYVILEKTAAGADGHALPVKVAVIGFADDYSAAIHHRLFSDLGFSVQTDFEAANALAADLEESGRCDATVLLTHGDSKATAESLGPDSMIDLVLGGHTHKAANGVTDWGLPYIQPSCYGQAYSFAKLEFREEKGSPVFKGIRDAQVCYTTDDPAKLAELPENENELDPEITALSDIFLEMNREAMQEEIGYITEAALKDEFIPGSGGRSSTMGNWMSTILMRAMGADAAFINSGGIRTKFRLEEGAEKRNITAGNVMEIFPFGNKIYLFEVTYEEFLSALQYSMTGKGSSLLARMAGVYCYYKDNTVKAVITKDGIPVYVDGLWKKGWKDRTLKVAASDYVATTDRPDEGLHNPLFEWSESDRLISSEVTDLDAALLVLHEEAAENDGHLEIDPEAYFVDLAE